MSDGTFIVTRCRSLKIDNDVSLFRGRVRFCTFARSVEDRLICDSSRKKGSPDITSGSIF